MNIRRHYQQIAGTATQPGPQPFTPAELIHIRSSFFSARGPVSTGPRPYQPDNCLSWGEYVNGHYTSEDSALCFAKWKSMGYTHALVGPFVDPGYHGQFPPVTFDEFVRTQDEVLVRIETMIQHRIVPVGMIGPDNWTLAQMEAFVPIFSQPRWQRALPLVCAKGFEPSADTSNAEWVDWLAWRKRVFPQSMGVIHMVSNMDCPGNNDDLTPGTPQWIGPAECWRRVAPYLSFFFGQYGPFETSPVQDHAQVEEWKKVFNPPRFKTGYAGWPTFSENGPDVPIRHVAAEYVSYSAWWQNLPESICQEWGDIALSAGADGAFDSCTA